MHRPARELACGDCPLEYAGACEPRPPPPVAAGARAARRNGPSGATDAAGHLGAGARRRRRRGSGLLAGLALGRSGRRGQSCGWEGVRDVESVREDK